MSKVVQAIGFMILLVWIMSIYLGYTALTDAAATLTATVKHAIAGEVMVPATNPEGGGYVDEQVGGSDLQLNIGSLTKGVAYAIPRVWGGSRIVVASLPGSITWTLPVSVAQGYGVTGPITIAPIQYHQPVGTAPPFLTTTVSIPVAVHTIFGSWTGTIRRAVDLPLAGQTGPGTFTPYSQSWFATYQSGWELATTGIDSGGWFTGVSAIGPEGNPNNNVPNGIWFASDEFTVTTSGAYNIQVQADDAAALYLDGQLIATTSLNGNGGSGVTVSETLTPGTHVLAAEVSNNGNGSTTIVPDNSGVNNPSALAVTVTSTGGQVLGSTESGNGWRVNPYPSSPPQGSVTSGALP